jgi:hypothetical protein
MQRLAAPISLATAGLRAVLFVVGLSTSPPKRRHLVTPGASLTVARYALSEEPAVAHVLSSVPLDRCFDCVYIR